MCEGRSNKDTYIYTGTNNYDAVSNVLVVLDIIGIWLQIPKKSIYF